MWNSGFCNFGPMFGSGHWFGGWFFPLLFWILILWTLFSLLKKIFISTKDKRIDSALDTLNRRYAAGEIDEHQFKEMKAAIAE